MSKEPVKENAMGGSVGAGGIAANPSRVGDISRRDVRSAEHDWHTSTKMDRERRMGGPTLQDKARENLKNAQEKMRLQRDKKARLKAYIAQKYLAAKEAARRRFRISESFNMNDIVSRLKDMEGRGVQDERDTVTYGVEDDNGNVMKITVRADQAQEFELRIAQELADIKSYKATGYEGKDISMGELLYNLKNEFDIIDVEFPEIPSDVVYNADKATVGAPDSNQGFNDELPDGTGEDMEGMGDMQDMEGMENPDMTASGGMEGGDMQDMEGMEAGEELEGGESEEMSDDGSVEDFPDDVSDEGGTASLLKDIIQMFKANAEAETAKANAEAEKQRALQAEWSAKAANQEAMRQEEILRMEQEMEESKKKQKEAKQIADIAKYRVSKANPSPLGESSFLRSIIMEYDQFDTPLSLQRQRAQLRLKYKPMPGDTPETLQHKSQALALALRELDARLRRARLEQRYDMNDQKQQNQNPNQNNQQNQQNQQNQNPNQQNGPNNGNM